MRRVLAPIVAPLAVLLTLTAAGPASASPVSNNVVGGSPRVVGGSPATSTAVPWQVLVLPDGYLCGGAILDATHVVTAAHCVYDDEEQEILAPSAITVHAGITNSNDAGQHPTVIGVSVNPDYDPDRQTSDVAILTLATPFSFTSTVKAIELTDVGYRPGSSDGLRLSGWGSDVARPPGDTTPQHAVDDLNVATLYPSTDCATVYASFDDNLLLCAGQAGTDACQGDSGGPLAVQIGGVWKLAGIVTGGAGCAWPGYPGYYARVANPEIHAFLADRGAGYAVHDPTVLSPPTITGATVPGGTLTCDVGTWKNAYAYDVAFFRGSTMIAYGSTMTVLPADVGASITCVVEAYGLTGTAEAISSPVTITAPPAPPPAPTVTTPSPSAPATPSPDAAAPKAHVTKLTCARSICTLDVRVDDPAPSAGIQGIEARVTTVYRAACVKRHKPQRCTKSVDRRLKTITTSPSTYRIVTPKLRKGTQTFRLLAIDRSGHRQAKATTVKKTTR
ncbi:MAG: serine protease [Solirubrobacterales bacterium]